MELSEPRALHRAAAYCSRAERSEFDVRRKLKDWKASEESADRIIEYLKEENYLSNERFAKSFINDKIKFNRWGKTKIIYELKKRQITEFIYAPLLNDISVEDFEEQLMQLLASKVRSVKGANDYERKTKLIRFALGRGFAMDLAIRCANKIMGGDYEESF